jgi:adenylate kinase family enzyme
MVVVGSSGCGKTTLARALADHLNVPHVEVDALHWGPDWTPMPTAILRARVAEAIAGDGWVIDGNYFKIREMVWSRADTLVWLDYSMGLILWRILRRTLRRCATRESLWQGNVETWKLQFLSRDSILMWVLTSWRRHRREFPKIFGRPEWRHLRIHRFRTPAETDSWLANFTGGAQGCRE